MQWRFALKQFSTIFEKGFNRKSVKSRSCSLTQNIGYCNRLF